MTYDLTCFTPEINDSDDTYTPYVRYTFKVKNVWKHRDTLCICSEKGEGFGIGKTYLFTTEDEETFKQAIGKKVTVWATMKIADRRNKWIALPSHYEA